MKQNPLKGRLISTEAQFDEHFLILQNTSGIHKIQSTSTDLININLGDLIEITDGTPKIITPNRSKKTDWTQRILNPRRIKGIKTRDQIEAGIREFFKTQDFQETRTPLLVRCPGMETHIRPFQLQEGPSQPFPLYLPTSPEFAMKKLLVGGLEKIFQICPAFRDEPHSKIHRPEFTLLEWYRAYAGYEEIMRDTECLFEFLAQKQNGKSSIEFQGRTISVQTPWPRLKVRDLFENFVGIDLVKCNQREDLYQEAKRLGLLINPEDTWDDLYFKIWLNLIEPNLPSDQAVFVTRYPASQAALAVIDQDPDGSSWAKRFEVYAGGIELGNAFEELTDPQEQRKRFNDDMNLREAIYGATLLKNPIDEEFLGALEEGMPPSGGIAIGVDRMVMLFGDEPDIDYTFWITH